MAWRTAFQLPPGICLVPSATIPVIDVFADDDEVGSGDGLGVVEFFKKGIGGRATGASFGGEEFQENRNAGSGDGFILVPIRSGIRLGTKKSYGSELFYAVEDFGGG